MKTLLGIALVCAATATSALAQRDDRPDRPRPTEGPRGPEAGRRPLLRRFDLDRDGRLDGAERRTALRRLRIVLRMHERGRPAHDLRHERGRSNAPEAEGRRPAPPRRGARGPEMRERLRERLREGAREPRRGPGRDATDGDAVKPAPAPESAPPRRAPRRR